MYYRWEPLLGLPRTTGPNEALVETVYNQRDTADVRFSFASNPGVQLFAHSRLLRTVEYFRDLLASDLNADAASPAHEIPDDDSDLSDDDDVGISSAPNSESIDDSAIEPPSKRRRKNDIESAGRESSSPSLSPTRLASVQTSRYRTSAHE